MGIGTSAPFDRAIAGSRHEAASLLMAVLVAIPAWTAGARAQCVDYRDYIHWVGGTSEGRGEAVAVAGSFAYIVGLTSLQVIDVSIPTAPRLVGSVDLPGGMYGNDIALAGDRAFVLRDPCGLCVVDVSHPEAPALRGGLDASGNYPGGVAASGDHVVLGEYSYPDSRLWVIDVADPDTPRIEGVVLVEGSVDDLATAGSLVYVAARRGGLAVVDVADPAAPRVLGQAVTVVPEAKEVAVAGSYAYVGELHDSGVANGLWVFDVASPSSPRVVGSLRFQDEVEGVAVSDGIVYQVGQLSGLIAIDVGAPAAPRLVGGVPLHPYARNVAVAGSFAYAVDWHGFQIIDVSTPASPPVVSSVSATFATDLALDGPFACMTLQYDGLMAIYIGDPTVPQIVGTAAMPDWAMGVDAAGLRAYVAADDAGLQVVDLTAPHGPSIIGSVALPGSARQVKVAGTTAHVVSDGNLQLVDVSTPQLPELVGTAITPGRARDVAVAADMAYVADADSGLQVISIAEPTAPYIVGSVDTPGRAESVAIAGTMAFVADDYLGLQVVDVEDPAAPRIVASLDIPGNANDLAIVDNIAYVTLELDGLAVIDVSDPTSPAILGHAPTWGTSLFGTVRSEATAVQVVAGHAFVATRGGLQILPAHCAVAGIAEAGGASPPGLLRLVPNPTRGAVTIRIERSGRRLDHMSIYDISGRLVRMLDADSATEGAGFAWDGRDAAGSRVATGTYLIRSEGGGSVVAGKVCVIR